MTIQFTGVVTKVEDRVNRVSQKVMCILTVAYGDGEVNTFWHWDDSDARLPAWQVLEGDAVSITADHGCADPRLWRGLDLTKDPAR